MRRPAHTTDEGAFTLLELILVMGVMGVLFGLGVGLLGNLAPEKRAALGLVQSVVRSARNNAVARAAPALVRLDLAGGKLAAAGLDVLGTWQFETLEARGSNGVDGIVRGGVLIERGFLGNALSFAGAPSGSFAEIPLHENSGFDLREGFQLRCAIELDGTQPTRVLDLGGAVGLECRSGGALRGWFRPEVLAASGLRSAGGPIAVDSAAGAWDPGRWMRVELAYDRRFLRLFVDGVEIARTEADAPVWQLEGPLVIGDRRAPLSGAIDALSIAAVVDSAEAALPKGVTLAANSPRTIAFSADGALDREQHAGPVTIELEYEDGSRARVLVNVYGTVE